MSLMVSVYAVFFPRGVLDGIWDWIVSVSVYSSCSIVYPGIETTCRLYMDSNMGSKLEEMKQNSNNKNNI